MGTYVDIGGIKIWFDEEGSGDPLVLLHGGLVTNATWGAQLPAFAERYHVFAPERRGHGHTPDVDGPFSFEDMATDAIGFLETVVGAPAHLVGWSDGGTLALLVAIRRPDLVRKFVSMGALYNTQGNAPEAEGMIEHMDPDAPDMAMFKEMYEASSPDGGDHWPVVVRKLVEMWLREPDISIDELGRIAVPALIMSGDDDMVRLDHTVQIYHAIPGAELAVVPGTSHAVLMEKPELVNTIILDFLTKEPTPTMMPMRRTAQAGTELAG